MIDMPRTAVTFDLDDTLAVVRGNRSEILNAAAREVGARGLTREGYLRAHRRHHANHSREPIFAELLQITAQPEVDPAALAAAYRRRIGEALEPVAGAEALIDHLSADRPVGLVTNGPILAQEDKLERLGWTDRFDAIVVSGSVGQAKPAAEPFLEACRRMNVDPSDTLHVGDRLDDDVRGARDAGLAAAYVTTDDAATDVDVTTVHRRDLADELPRHVAACCPV